MKRQFLAVALGLIGAFSGAMAEAKQVRNFIFGNSMINHASDDPGTTVPYWLNAFAKAGGHSYFVDGAFGHMVSHTNVPPQPQWGFPGVRGVWNLDAGTPFSGADFTHITFTTLNFIQYNSPTTPYDGDNPRGLSPVSATVELIDWLESQEPGITIQLYVGWPDMGGIAPNFPPNASQLSTYLGQANDAYKSWNEDFFAELRKERPNTKLEFIPVGPVLADIFKTYLKDAKVTDIYEDNAPHGTSTLYFLAGLITYVHMYDEPVPAGLNVPPSIHPAVKANFKAISDRIWELRDKKSASLSAGEAAIQEASGKGVVAPLKEVPELTPGLKATFHHIENAESLDDIAWANVIHEDQVQGVSFKFEERPLWDGGPYNFFAARYSGHLRIENAGDHVFF